MIKCQHCGKEYSQYGIHSHIWRKHGDGINFTANNHNRVAWNKGLTKYNNSRVKKYADTNSRKWRNGEVNTNVYKTKEYRNKLSLIAKKNGLGGYNENAGKSKKFYVKDSYGNDVCLQSSYEMKCANILNEIGVKWIRPKPLNYLICGTKKRYFPDFYLPEQDLYLDPKNSYLIQTDTNKIKLTQEQNNVVIIIIPKGNLNKDDIRSKIKS